MTQTAEDPTLLNSPVAPPEGHSPARRGLLAVLSVIILLAAAGVAQTSAGRDALRSLGLYPAPTPFTELYLADPGQVLSTVAPRHKVSSTPIAFVIRNEEHRARIYSWNVKADTGRNAPTGQLTLGSGQQKTVRTNLRFRCQGQRTKVTVNLLQPAQSLFYWVRCFG
jgi:hypothetical protein